MGGDLKPRLFSFQDTDMRQPDVASRAEYTGLMNGSPSLVSIPGTRKTVRVDWLHPGTIERLTGIWIERDMASARIAEGKDVAKDLVQDPYLAFKEAALIILNNDIKIRLFYPLYWRWLAYKYNETQMEPIIVEGKKKLPLMAHYRIMAYSLDMRADWVQMTAKEAGLYRQEPLSAEKPLLSKTSPHTGNPVGGSSAGSGASGTGGS